MNNAVYNRVFLAIALMALSMGTLRAQGRIVVNGGRVKLNNGAVLVIANSAANAITRSSGFIVSEGENNRIRWNIGTTTGTYTIPWGNASGSYIPVSFSPSAASGIGYLNLSTYPTTSQNSIALPTGISNFNNAVGIDASVTAVDRFWRIEPVSYTSAPAMSNLVFTYTDAEYAAPNKTSIENKLTARGWNSTSLTWHDYVTGGVVNTAANTVTIASVPSSQQRSWWSIQYPGAEYHWVATSTGNSGTAANWASTAGGTGGAGVPSSGDAVYFDDLRDANCIINSPVDIGQLTVATGYTGTITQGLNAVAIEGDVNFSSGAFNGGNASLAINGSVNISGATFTGPSAVMDVKRNFTVSSGGTFTHNNGTVRFSGTSGAQTINAPGTTFHSIDVTNTATTGLVFESNNQMGGVLTLATNVQVDPDGASDNRILTLLSSADNPTADAAIGILPSGASVNGRVTVQRYMAIEGANGGRIYRYIASPLAAATVADIQTEIPITGTFTGTSACVGCTTSQSMFSYDESVITDINGNGVANQEDGYLDFPQNSNLETLVPGRGYSMFVRGSILTSARWDVRGLINAGNVTPITFPVSYTSSGVSSSDGWNLVGNPYPSTIDWNASSGWTKTNLNGSFYTRDNSVTGGQYAAWNGVVGTNGGSRYIAIGQAFWVKANAAVPVLIANENVKAAGTQTVFFREDAPANLLRITLKQGTIRDEAVVHLRADATNEFDAHADATKMQNVSFNLSTLVPGKGKMAINSLDQSLCSTTVNLSVDNAAKGSYSLSFEGLESFGPSATIILNDAYLNTATDIRDTNAYPFNVTADATSYGNARFSLTITRQPAPMNFAASALPVCSGSDAQVVIAQTSADIAYDVMVNDSLFYSEHGRDGEMNLIIPSSLLNTGENKITVNADPLTGCGIGTEKYSTLIVEGTDEPQTVISDSVCRKGTMTLSANGATEGQQYQWYLRSEDKTPLAYGNEFLTPALEKSRTYYVSIANVLGCEGKRIPVEAHVVLYDDPSLSVVNDTLVAEYAGEKQWYLDGVLLPAQTNSFMVPDYSGVYTIRVKVESCEASASMRYTKPEIITGLPEIEPELELFPNPVARYLFLRDRTSSLTEAIVQNASGQQVGTFSINYEGDTVTGRFDMSSLPSGIYIVQLVKGNMKVEKKVVKE